MLLVGDGNRKGALAASNEAVEKKCLTAAVYNNRAYARMIAPGDRSPRDWLLEVERDLDDAERLDPGHPTIAFNRAVWFELRFSHKLDPDGREKAINKVHDAIALHSTSAALHKHGADWILARPRSTLREIETAVHWLGEAVRLVWIFGHSPPGLCTPPYR